MTRTAQRLATLRTPWRLRYALRRRAMLFALRVVMPPGRAAGLERIGSAYGGWTVPVDELSSSCVAYCAGAGVDVTFDLGIVSRFGCDVVTIDPTEESREHVAQVDPGGRLRFVPAALWREDGELEMFVAADPSHRTLSSDDLQRTGRSVRVPARSLRSLMTELGHDRLDLLKLDVEGAEYELLPDAAAAGVRVLCVEMHPTRGLREAVRAFRRLRAAGYELVARHGADFTFVRRD